MSIESSPVKPLTQAVRRRMVAGNWKMNGSIEANERLLEGIVPVLEATAVAGRVQIVICPPFPYLGQARGALAGADGLPGPIALGAQNVAAQSPGAFTGEVAAQMLVDLGCTWVIIGHSERRALFGDTDEVVAAKCARALEQNLGVILCVGETLDERNQGRAESVVASQLAACAPVLGGVAADRVVIAYEPVWAIGTGKTATPAIAQQMHAFIRQRLVAGGWADPAATRILYGGSVKSGNAGQLFSEPDIDGGLIGGAALQADEFISICRAAA